MKQAAIKAAFLALTVANGAMGFDIRGSGSSFQTSIQRALTQAYSAVSDNNVTFNPMGSIPSALATASGSVHFGGAEFISDSPNIESIPLFMGALVVPHNLPACTDLKLSRETVVGIFDGSITQWNDPLLLALNTDATKCTLPNQAIRVAVRSDASTVTLAFTNALSSFSAQWKAQKGAATQLSWSWLNASTKLNSNAGVGMLKNMLAFSYSIGYTDLADARIQNLRFARIRNRNGDFVLPDLEAVSALMAGVTSTNNTAEYVDSALPNTYPIVTFTYVLLNKRATSAMMSLEEMRHTLRFLDWSLTSSYAKSVITEEEFAWLSDSLRQKSREMLQTISHDGVRVFGQSSCDKEGMCDNEGSCDRIMPFTDPSVKCKCPPLWTNKQYGNCSEPADYEYISTESGSAVTVIVLTVLGWLVAVGLQVYLIVHRQHPAMKTTSVAFWPVFYFGYTVASASTYNIVGEPTVMSCATKPYLLSAAFGSMCSVISAKQLRIINVFGKFNASVDSLAESWYTIKYASVVMSINLFLCTVWSIVDLQVPTSFYDEISGVVYRGCSSSSPTTQMVFSIVLYIYNACILLYCFSLANRTNKFKQIANEANPLKLTSWSVTFLLCLGAPIIHIGVLDYMTIFVMLSLMLVFVPFQAVALISGPVIHRIMYPEEEKDLIKKPDANVSAKNVTANHGATPHKALQSGEVQPSGMSFWHFSVRRHRIGATWEMMTIVVNPEMNWMVFMDDFESVLPMTFEIVPLTGVEVTEESSVDAEKKAFRCLVKTGVGNFSFESEWPELMAKWKTGVCRKVQAPAASAKGGEAGLTSVNIVRSNGLNSDDRV